MFISSGSVASRDLGVHGEQFACDYLEKCLGWRVIARNVRTRFGEIDAIATSAAKKTVFIEVRTRSSSRFGSPVESISDRKVSTLHQQANYYIAKNRLDDSALYCLDFIGLFIRQHEIQSIEHLRIFP